MIGNPGLRRNGRGGDHGSYLFEGKSTPTTYPKLQSPPASILFTPGDLRWAPSTLSCGHSGLASPTTLTPTSLEELGFGLVRFGSTKCFRVFQPRPLSGEDGFKAGDNFLVRKIKTEGSNRN